MVGFDWKGQECRTDGAVGQCPPEESTRTPIAIRKMPDTCDVEQILLARRGQILVWPKAAQGAVVGGLHREGAFTTTDASPIQ